MGKDVDTHSYTGEDRMRYREKVKTCLDVFGRMLTESAFDAARPLVGLELELNLVDANVDPALRNAHVLEVMADPAFVTELGQFNIEINVPPRPPSGDGLAQFESQLRDSLNAAERHANSVGVNLAMIGIWVRLLSMPYRLLYPAILLFCLIGVYSTNTNAAQLVLTAIFMLFGYVLLRFGCEPAPLVLGFILGPLMEENLRRSLVLARGDPMIFINRPISATLLALTVVIIGLIVFPQLRKKRDETFLE